MWWLLATASAGKLVPPVQQVRCEGDTARDQARAHFEAEGLLAEMTALEIAMSPMCCTAMTVAGVDAAGLRAGGTLALNYDCALLGISPEVQAGRAVYTVVALGPSPPTPTGASVLRPAYEALARRAHPVDDLLVAVRVERGWHVWLLRPNEVDVLTVARAELDRDGVVVRVVDDVRPWVPSPAAEAARTVWSLERRY